MKRLLVSLMVFCALVEVALAGEGSKDPYSEELVTVIARRTAPLISMQEKVINRLGDAAAIGLIRHAGVQAPSTPGEIEGILFVVRMAFGAPDIISTGADREPKATLVLLSWLTTLPVSDKLKGRIEETRAYVLRQIENYKRKQSGGNSGIDGTNPNFHSAR